MKKSSQNSKYYFFGVVFIILLWMIISIIFDNSNLIFPNFFKVLNETIKLLGNSFTFKVLGQTFVRLLIGFVCSFVIALFLGTIAGNNEKFKYFVRPLMVTLKTIPTASLVFLFLVLAGAKNAPIYIVVLICLPILYESIVSGYENIDRSIDDAIKLENGNKLEKIIELRLPQTIPFIMSGIASSLGLSFKIEIMAEILTGSSNSGLGSMIGYIQRNDPTNMTGIFSYSLIAIIISIIIDIICEKIVKNN